MVMILPVVSKTEKAVPSHLFISGKIPSSGKKILIGKNGFVVTRNAKKRFSFNAVLILFLSLMVFLPLIPNDSFRAFLLSIHALILVGIIRFEISDQRNIQRRFLESATMEARTAVTGETTGGNSKTATNRSPLLSSPSGCDQP